MAKVPALLSLSISLGVLRAMIFPIALVLTLLSAFTAVNALPINDSTPARSIRPRQLAGVITSCTVPNTAALTFDDGPYQYLYVCPRSILIHFVSHDKNRIL